ncbi:MAG: flagellar filament capping protein FliD, partial [Acidimicrobiales bacterium]|nr:flagellar filament capping protein FliD [Acidimicrobiales bacterium]HLV91434.1 flagellar filament capping protein FliD [Acidimicrobiia bacterium]
ATGSGRALTADTGAARGLVVSVLVDQTAVDGAGGSLQLGSVTATGGLIGSISRAVSHAEGVDGAISRAREHWKAQIDLVDDRIARMEDRLATIEDRLIHQFTAMESMLAQLASQQMWLQAQLAGLTQPQT